jgi:hypothetical protein
MGGPAMIAHRVPDLGFRDEKKVTNPAKVEQQD